MAIRTEALPCITINSDGTVRVIVDGKSVDLRYSDYIIARDSGKSPFSRVFVPTTPKIVTLNVDEEEDN